MKSKTDAFAPLVEAAKSVGGRCAPRYFAGRNNPNHFFEFPAAGNVAADFEVRQSIGSVTITTTKAGFLKGFSDLAYGMLQFAFDEEFLTIEGWTVRNGVFIMAIKYELPEKYKEITKYAPHDPEEFCKKHGVE